MTDNVLLKVFIGNFYWYSGLYRKHILSINDFHLMPAHEGYLFSDDIEVKISWMDNVYLTLFKVVSRIDKKL